MLEMGEGRIGFAEALRPPAGYEVSLVVGTTYSLDLRALLGLCIPLGLGFEPEALESINPVSLFAALQKLRDKLVIYCDKGGIKADIPSNERSAGLVSLLEGVVHQVHVNAGSPGVPASFHPKVWVVEYTSSRDGERRWRLLVMSRNLTFDTSWDVVAQLEGAQGESCACAHQVANFLEFLADGSRRIDTERDDTRKRDSHTVRIRRLARDLRGVEFFVDDKSFDTVDFLPFGPSWQGGSELLLEAQTCELFESRLRSVLVVSPFLSDGADAPLVRMARNRSGDAGRYVLLSREDSLERMDDTIRDAYECYCPMPDLADVELDDQDGVDAADYSNIHAKLYFTEDRSRRRVLYIGSLNASLNGTVNNVEALIRLGVRKGYHTFDSMLRPLIQSTGKAMAPFSPYVPFEADSSEDAEEQGFRRAFRQGAKRVAFKRVTVREAEEGRYALAVTLDVAWAGKLCAGISFVLRPLLSDAGHGIEVGQSHGISLNFGGLKPQQVSAMFVLCGTDVAGHSASCVLVCPHDRYEDAAYSIESRSKALLGEILNSEHGALAQYLAHAFDLPEGAYAINDEAEDSPTGKLTRAQVVPPGFYEKLLVLADSNPEVFDRANELLALLPQDVRTKEVDELRNMVDTFAKAVQ